MIKLTFKVIIQAGILKDTFDAIGAIVKECKLKIYSDEIVVLAVDLANVAMVKTTLHKSAFSEYTADEQEIGIDVAKLMTILTTPTKTDFITIELEQNRIKLSFNGYEYAMALLDLNTIRKEPKEPTLTLPGKVQVPSNDLNTAIKAMANVADKALISIRNESVFVEADDDINKVIKEFSGIEVTFISNVESQSIFSIDYLKNMLRIASKAETLKLNLGDDMPLIIIFELHQTNLEITYLLAPRIENG